MNVSFRVYVKTNISLGTFINEAAYASATTVSRDYWSSRLDDFV